MSYYSPEELASLGLNKYGKNVFISDKVSLYRPEKITLGNNVRIDDYCVLSAGENGIHIGNNVHIAVFCSLMGQGEIIMSDFSGLSSRVSIYSSTDDYSGNYLTNPTVPSEFTNVISGPVILEKHVIIGSGSVILPNVTLHSGAAVGALTLVNKSCDEFSIYLGVPAKKIMKRKRGMIDLENNMYGDVAPKLF